jgi:hypothetical protein
MRRVGAPDFQIGQRVKIRRDSSHGPGPWPAEPTGEVRRHPEAAEGEVSVPTHTVLGLRRSYLIAFDVPQFDADGDGPYTSSEVLDKYVDAQD